MFEERQIWTTGRRGAVVCVTTTIYPHSIVATAEAEHITERQMAKALNKEFPRHTFCASIDHDWIRADADRFTNDGVD